jgi:hypothetical protein
MIKRRASSSSARVLHITEEEFAQLPLGVEPDVIDSMVDVDSKRVPKGLSDGDLQQLLVLKSKLKGMSTQNKEVDFISHIEEVMAFLEGDSSIGQKKEICLYVMYKLERFLLKPKMGPQKLQLAVRLLKPLFGNDDDTTQTVIQLCMREHRQIGRIGRVTLRLYRFFFKR